MRCKWMAMLLAFGGSAYAGGLEIPDHGARAVARGGAFGARADDPTAVAHNPGRVAHLEGLQLAWNHNLVWSHARFTRAESVIPDDNPQYDKDPFATVENESPFFGLGAFLAATYDLPWEGLAVGLSVFGPSGSGHAEYPVQGGQRYMLTRFDALMLYYGLTIAWGTDDFGVGATLQWADMPKLEYRLVVDAKAGSALSPYASGTDVHGIVTVSDRFAPAAILGAWWRPVPTVEVGLSGRPFPIVFEAEGDLEVENVPDQSEFTEHQRRITGSAASVEVVLPPTARVATRYVHGDQGQPLFDIELDFVYEAWSMVEAYKLDLEGEIQLFAGDPVQDAVIERRWRDTLSLRLGGTYFATEWLGISLGGYWERGATPEQYTHLDLLSLDRLGVGGGLEIALGAVDINIGYLHTFQPDVTVGEGSGKVYQQRPVAPCPDRCGGLDGVPANAGTFESGFDLLSVSVGGTL